MDAATKLRLAEGDNGYSAGERVESAEWDPATVIADHLWLARSVANRYRRRGEDFDDLLQVAYLGLVEAVNRFDPARGEFISFAVPTISGVIKRHFRDHGWMVRPSRHTQELVASIRREWSELAQELGQIPTNEQLAERLGEDVHEVAQARCAADNYRPVSIDALAEGIDRLDLSNGSDTGQLEAQLVVHRVLRKLDDEDRRLIWMRFYEERSQSDIAGELGTSQMQISRRLAKLLHRLRQLVGADEQSQLVA